MNCPSSAFGALAHLIFDGLKQFFDGFDRNFASLVLDSISQFVKGFCLPSTIIHSLFEDSPVLFHSRGRLWPADSSPLEEIGCSFLAEPVTHPDRSVQRPNQVINSMSRHCDVACWREQRWCTGFGSRTRHWWCYFSLWQKSTTLSPGLHWLIHCLLWCTII